jgi:hypothetical protein
MTIAKSLMLACLASLSLGVGAANAQNLTPTSGEASYFTARVAATEAPDSNAQIHSNSSDLARPGAHPAQGQR